MANNKKSKGNESKGNVQVTPAMAAVAQLNNMPVAQVATLCANEKLANVARAVNGPAEGLGNTNAKTGPATNAQAAQLQGPQKPLPQPASAEVLVNKHGAKLVSPALACLVHNWVQGGGGINYLGHGFNFVAPSGAIIACAQRINAQGSLLWLNGCTLAVAQVQYPSLAAHMVGAPKAGAVIAQLPIGHNAPPMAIASVWQVLQHRLAGGGTGRQTRQGRYNYL